MSKYNLDLTILIPALNEEKSISICVQKAKNFISKNNLNAEVLVIDNNSTDNTGKIALENGAKVEVVKRAGYGSALQEGIKLAHGKYTIMADADDSYNLLEIFPIYQKLIDGYDLVIGNRYAGEMEKGSMKFSHKYFGTPIISLIGRLKYKVNIKDFFCGLRGFNTEKMLETNCISTGMQYALEMIIKSKEANLSITEIPINFYKDKRDGKSHLSTIKDGAKCLKTLIKYK